jgi:predicted DNA-binding transcriptional regulator AlpA
MCTGMTSMDYSTNLSALQDVSRRHSIAERDDRRVMSFYQWCELNGFSKDTGRRLIKTGQGPKVLQLSPRRIGITVAANREWQQARERV